MEELSERETPFTSRRRRGPDLLNAVMLGFTVIFLLGSAWIRFGPKEKPPSLVVGDIAPLIRLNDLEGQEPIVMLGLRNRVLWLTFWSVKSPEDRRDFRQLERIWKRFEGDPGFALLVSAIATDDPRGVHSEVASKRLKFPVYLASPETCRDFGAEPEELPLHFIIDADGRILAISHGRRDGSLDQLEELVRSRLKMRNPAGGSRFAMTGPPGLGSRTGVVARATGR